MYPIYYTIYNMYYTIYHIYYTTYHIYPIYLIYNTMYSTVLSDGIAYILASTNMMILRLT